LSPGLKIFRRVVMMFLKRFLPLALVTAALLSSCSTLCCDKASSRIEADIAIATNRKEDADAAQKDAYRRMSWAEDFGLEDDFSEEYQDAIASFHPANMAYDDMKYGTARKLYLEVSAILSDDFQARATECRDEKAKVDLAMTKALEACADTLAPQRFKDAQDLYIKAKALKAAGDLPNAITTCKKASAAFEYAFEYATVMKLRDSIRDCEILKEYNKEFLLAESKIMEDEALWKHGTVKDYALGTSILREAGRQYSWILEQCRKLQEEKRIAVEKAEAARLAAEKLAQEKAAADGALACAREGMAWTDEQHLEVDYVDDYEKGKALLADAESRYASGDYVGATASANEVCSQFGEEYRGKVKAERGQVEAARLAAEKLAQEKAAADGALACARAGMIWADEQRLEVDYADDYEKGKALLADAESRYASGDYVGATASANEVCSQFGEEYRGKVKAEREQAEAARLAAEKRAQEKLAAEKQQEPVKAVVKTYPEYFSPDDDGLDDMMTFDTSVPGDTGVKQWVLEVFEEYIVDPSAKTYSVSKRSFITWFGTGTPPEKIAWDGKSDKNELVQSGTTYPYIFSYTDKLDRVITTQGAIIVGIIAQKTGDTINIKLPSLVFRADKADFLELDPHVIERNNLLVGKLAESLNKYSDYNITVEGHANNVGKIMGYSQTRIQEEENTQVLPLSIARAEKLRSMLIEQGIDPNLISVVGYGSSRPVVSFTDAVNRWKNRRVEFTLTRKK
jgi:outer membrane protein OmpA-like peptidoglycan-associated protein